MAKPGAPVDAILDLGDVNGRPDVGRALDVLDRAVETRTPESERPEIDAGDLAGAPAPGAAPPPPPPRGPGRPKGTGKKRKPRTRGEYRQALKDAEVERAELTAQIGELSGRLQLLEGAEGSPVLSTEVVAQNLSYFFAFVGHILGRTLGPKWIFEQEECDGMGQAWAIPLAPLAARSEVAAAAMPWTGALFKTGEVVTKRLDLPTLNAEAPAEPAQPVEPAKR